MRRDWTGPARTKSRVEWGSTLLLGAVMGGMGDKAEDRPRLTVTALVFGGCSGPDRMGAGPKLGRTIQSGGRRGAITNGSCRAPQL